MAASLRSVARRRILLGQGDAKSYFISGIAAIISLTRGNAFSNPGHKPVASHQNKTVKAETGKRRAVTDASLRNKAALEDDDE